jgi:ATP-binding cassette subfamily F protein 3
MDMPSVQCLEDALSEFEGAIIIISHDRKFIKKLVNTEWKLEEADRVTKLKIKF